MAARDSFIAVAAHELRNPMTPMVGQIELLLSGVKAGRYTPQQIEQRLERIQSLMLHYIKRSATLLDVSRITSGNLKLAPASCDLILVVKEVIETYAEATRHAGVSIKLDLPSSLSGTWDQLALEQIIDNLMSNAIKYGEGGPIEVGVIDLGNTICLRIRDQGPGISLDDRARIFDRFERAVGVDSRHSGFGVGLWLVRQLTEAMGGTISVETGLGVGSVFSVVLPRHGTATPT
ncbi:HAMP domain-containing histidine kinase (plasmid) [Lichenicola cladoniae]|uniref:histidine kinase n=1 Tax=Lichenicola cladoniae TaxID=1484109 RepID=A0A6M8HZ47_9PROT|nr:HAMP domain-containing histidine kinase [Acetobacteraceae bacterium]QKE93809.1 HAMP domain-containing histidine kinase [Lichenicola cladoniae]